MGKLRRVFSGNLKKSKSNGTGRKLFYYVVVFKHENDFYRTFDVGSFHEKISEKFIPEYLNASEIEKQKIFDNYIQSIKQDIDNTEVVSTTKDGYLVAEYNVKSRNTIEGGRAKRIDTGRRRKKKNLLKNDFYKF